MTDTKKTEVVRSEAKPKLVTKMAERFEVAPEKFLDTLKDTAFKQRPEDPPITNEQMMALLVVANEYQLNPFTKQIYAFPDKKNGIVPIVGVDGWSAIINERSEFDGMEFVYEEIGNDTFCTCIIHRKDREHPTKVCEILSECKRNTPAWQSHPMRMLRHKALIQCARLAFGLTGIYDHDEGERIIEGETIRDDKPKSGGVVDSIVDAEVSAA